MTDNVITGLRYSLVLSANAGNGTGAPQTYGITATFPAGQAGTCAGAICNATQAHTLTITY
ncbi:hypothetical protein [Ramlibacter montanisoli]|uniref:Spore coat protein U domain-containing protein n=1 Tax=Ramlibacter montanisoli TaxID=2732512 RepID=A0A849KDF4_9BURK|nr:hypothetical protein [Ramlibacter montanisoli]NNU44524.1 hypothetical protein [Ramlibacter montanisoli]